MHGTIERDIQENKQRYRDERTNTKNQQRRKKSCHQTSMHRLYDPEYNKALNGEREEKEG